MGSAAEEKNGWSEDEADTLLSLVGTAWRVDENNVTTNGALTNGTGNNTSACVIHAMPHVCWCEVCSKGLCRVCSQEHQARGHNARSLKEMSETLTATLEAETLNLGKLLNEVYRCERKQQDLVLKVIEALSQAKKDLEEDLMSGSSFFAELPQVQDLLTSARKSLANGNSESLSHLSALISSLTCRKQQLEGILFRAMVSPLHACGSSPNTEALKLIHSYTSAKLGLSNFGYTNGNGGLKSQSALISPPKYSPNSLCVPSVGGPRFFFDMDIQGVPLGRIIIETRPDVAPKMCENFKALTTKERGFGFQGCVVFQCWKGESVITGDFEHNNGRGGHSIYEEGLFMPEDTRLPATRGAIGMRRTQKRHDSKGLVGSQFRIILQDMPGFTGIFGHILEGIEIVDKISECGDPSGNPTKRITIRKCGAYK
ncbi:unnamed protein product [Orchesella dallaii]|uniref:PPIase cyclophilin-type domain-containing protein n=1 Tax=Orchesella dallaii TaxID=48710 RepID=A0ABP1RE05_9HEXA